MNCKHENGWVAKEEFCIGSPESWGENIEVECECNNSGCGKRRTFRFDISCIKEIKK